LARRSIPKDYFCIVHSYQGSWHVSPRAFNIPKGGSAITFLRIKSLSRFVDIRYLSWNIDIASIRASYFMNIRDLFDNEGYICFSQMLISLLSFEMEVDVGKRRVSRDILNKHFRDGVARSVVTTPLSLPLLI
jgi:hypothetical protein